MLSTNMLGGMQRSVPLAEDDEILAKAIASENKENKKFSHINCSRLKTWLLRWGRTTPKEERLFEHSISIIERRKDEEKGLSKSITFNSSTDSSTIKSDVVAKDFSKLSKISISDLELFSTAKGKFIEGRLLSEPLVTVGIMTFIEDENGDYVQLGLYNMVPNNDNKQQVASLMFPVGARIHISEPFFKIFQDGNKGIRVDSPAEVQILKEGVIDFQDVREQGKKLFQSGNYLQALGVYLDVFRQPNAGVISRLCKKAESHMKRNEFEDAVLDSAAVLFIHGQNETARHSYNEAMHRLQEDCGNAKEIWMVLLQKLCNVNKATNTRKKCDVQQDGEELTDSQLCMILTNIAVVSMKTEMYQSAIAAANAVLRITEDAYSIKKARFAMTKSFSMLGEIHFAKILAGNDESLKEFWSEEKSPQAVITELLKSFVGLDDKFQIDGILEGENIAIDYISPNSFQHVYIPGKGRGLIVTRDIQAGEILLIDHLILTNRNPRKDITYTFSMDGQNKMSLGYHLDLASKMMNLMQYDGLLAMKFLLLDGKRTDEENLKLPLMTDLSWFAYRSLSHDLLPFLAQTPEELKVDVSKLTYDLIKSVLQTNTFSWNSDPEYGGYETKEGSGLMLRASLLNHDKNPNCAQTFIGDAGVFVAKRRIPKNSEVTIFYSSRWNEKLSK